MPFYRQIKDLQRLGLDVSETTLCHWTINSAEVLASLYGLDAQRAYSSAFPTG
ncbi:IS66 family transposase [Lacticaseibacillus paracasei]|nr:IS66 family transposase [Lacticaseibacillus paracasei]